MRLLNFKYLPMKYYSFILVLFFLFNGFLFCSSEAFAGNTDDTFEQPFITELRARGFSLLPAPQKLELSEHNVIVDGSWIVSSNVSKENIAIKRLIQGADELHKLSFSANGQKKIVLSVKPGTVNETSDPALNEQGYLLRVTPALIEITGNGNAGLFYGVQSFLQLLRRDATGDLILPECVIKDWPSLQLRFVHWDTKHHQKRMETMKRLIDWHAFFKVNMIAFEMEDKYEYPSHPVIGAPGAYTKAEMQELTRYALQRHIQIVPDIQSPAHMNYVLKHEQFAHLKSDGSNYQICMCDPEAISLIFDMYQDMIDATPGVDYFLVSTDEVYYAGICDKCEHTYNDENRSLAWAEFVNKTRDWLAERGRRQISWIEHPLLPEHVKLLPSDIIDGVFSKQYLEEENKIGIRQLSYNSMQGEELLFPNLFPTEYQGREIEGRLIDIINGTRKNISDGANLIGNITASWDDSGLHEEVFQLGWASGAQYGWNPFTAGVNQNVADFMSIFYGQSSPDMVPVYKLMQEGARFFEKGWDVVESKERGPSYGNHIAPGLGTGRTDRVMTMPAIPSAENLQITNEFSTRYSEMIVTAQSMKTKNDDLLNLLTTYIAQIERNRYNLEVFLSIAYLERYFIKTVLSIHDVEELMIEASAAAAAGKPKNAVGNLIEASNRVSELMAWGDWMWQNLEKVWEKSRYKKNRSVDGQDFIYVMDDVKDHFADRRKGLDYMLAPFQRLDLPNWQNRLNERINEYAKSHNVPVTGLGDIRLED